jgi:hypothetical protein
MLRVGPTTLPETTIWITSCVKFFSGEEGAKIILEAFNGLQERGEGGYSRRGSEEIIQNENRAGWRGEMMEKYVKPSIEKKICPSTASDNIE